MPFFSASATDFVELFVGLGASRVRDLFEQARKNSPCIIFIDEIDVVGRARSGAGALAGNDEREHTLEQLLVEMDGFEPNETIIVLAATNRADVLDPALLRPGRFDRQVMVDRPERRGREAILRIHTRNVPLAPDVSLEELSRLTPGFAEEIALGEITSGAENNLKEATRQARRMVTAWGMGEQTGLVTYDLDGENALLGQRGMEGGTAYSETTAERVDAEVERLLEQARPAIFDQRAALERLAQELLREEVLDHDQVLAIIGVERTMPGRAVGGESAAALSAKHTNAALP